MFPLLGVTTMRREIEGHGLGLVTARIEIPRHRLRMLGELLVLPLDHGPLRVISSTRLRSPGLRRVIPPRLRAALRAGVEQAFAHLPSPPAAAGNDADTPYRRWAARPHSGPDRPARPRPA